MKNIQAIRQRVTDALHDGTQDIGLRMDSREAEQYATRIRIKMRRAFSH